MKLKQVVLCVIAPLCLLQISSASAISLNFSPGDQSVSLGQSVSVDIVVSGLGAADEIVSAHDLFVSYDAGKLTATDVQFGSDLGDELFFEVFNDFDLSVAGVVDFAQLSLLSDDFLAGIQGDSVTLATISFDSIGVGVASLLFIPDAVAGVTGQDVKGRDFLQLDLDEVGAGSVTINDIAVIPLPGAALLMLTGLLGVGFASRKRQQHA